VKSPAIISVILLCTVFVLSACSESAPQANTSVLPRAAASTPPCGVAGITFVNNPIPQTLPDPQTSSVPSSPTPSPLPGGFSRSDGAMPMRGCLVAIVALSGEHPGQVVARLRSDADGLFAAQLPPGRYEVRARLPHQPFTGKAGFTVTADGFTRVMVQGAAVW
jgi:hypothetical protein